MPTAGRCLVFYLALLPVVCLARDAHIVSKWADELGNELWKLAIEIGRPDELLEKYRSMNTRVEDKSGEKLVEIISKNVSRMLRRKMDAITCIRMAAEEAAESWDPSLVDSVYNTSDKSYNYKSDFSYFSAKCSPVKNNGDLTVNDDVYCQRKNTSMYREMEVTSDSHFYTIPVNTSYSSVHIPTNVFDLKREVVEDIVRTEPLDSTFCKNYESDPALSWQYFGSVTGMLRVYPAMQWQTPEDKERNPVADTYDCRVRSWFIEASTCSKDVVILIDVSGSMTGMGKTIAKTTVNSILDTLSNNDFVTVLKYHNETDDLVPCFKDMLVQATPENLDVFKKSMDDIKTERVANVTEALVRAFGLLKTYRNLTRGCDADTPCNQLIMVVTDGVLGNLTEVFKRWNRMENGTHIPVRVFPYLLGKEVSKVQELKQLGCMNRGYFRHVRTQEEVREQVLTYIPVVARPLVLQGEKHPIVWTHTYADITNPALAAWLWDVMENKGPKTRLQKYLKGKQLGVRINEDAIYIKQLHEDENIEANPSDLNTTAWQEYRLLTSVSTPVFDRRSNRNNKTREANLLGVAGTDVPIDDIRKLTLPYKLGVNGYAFIVSNNGYVILHPDLRPVSRGQLKLNYNSIDLTEVEILDDGSGPRKPGQELLKLRSALVDHKRGSMRGIPVKLHYDDNRRVNLERRDYFYAPLNGTPFSLAVVIPDYGTTWIKVGDEIRRIQDMRMNITDYFVGDHWRVHPGWVYCRYHYLEGHEFDSREDELLHFLALMSRPGWTWSEQYEADTTDEEVNCEKRTLKRDDYYCNRELMQLLVFDAKATNDSFRGDYLENLPPRARELAREYGIFIRFIATQSGLTRWHHLHDSSLSSEDGVIFGDLHRRAVNEPWYKAAIIQNDTDSISLSVPSDAGPDAIVTASMSLSPKDGGKKAPAAVVGFQMPITNLHKRLVELTSTTNPSMNCSNTWIDCYLLDQNGYVVISEAHTGETGRFIGTLEGAVTESMVEQGLYNSVEIYDYQAWCHEKRIDNAASIVTGPLQYVKSLLIWLLLRLAWLATQCANLPGIYGKVHFDEDAPDPPPPPKPYLYYYPCDQKRTLYMMNNTIAARGVTNHTDYCSRPFYAQKVAHTNLLLLVVNSLCPTCYKSVDVTPATILPFEYTNGMADAPCHKIPLNELKRRRLENCFTDHPLEDKIVDCGRASGSAVSLPLMCIAVATILYTHIAK